MVITTSLSDPHTHLPVRFKQQEFPGYVRTAVGSSLLFTYSLYHSPFPPFCSHEYWEFEVGNPRIDMKDPSVYLAT